MLNTSSLSILNQRIHRLENDSGSTVHPLVGFARLVYEAKCPHNTHFKERDSVTILKYFGPPKLDSATVEFWIDRFGFLPAGWISLKTCFQIRKTQIRFSFQRRLVL